MLTLMQLSSNNPASRGMLSGRPGTRGVVPPSPRAIEGQGMNDSWPQSGSFPQENPQPGPGGEGLPADRMLPLVYEELRRLAQAKINNEPAGLTLQPTALVHEAYLRIAHEHGEGWRDRNHFFAAAALAMRRILIERARRKGAQVRRDAARRDLDAARDVEDVDLLALDDALVRLGATVDSRLVEVVQLRFFAGLSVEQTAEVMGVSPRTIKRDWNFARAWLLREMGDSSSIGVSSA